MLLNPRELKPNIYSKMTSKDTIKNNKNHVKKIKKSCFLFLFKTNLIAKTNIKNLIKPIDLDKDSSV